MKPNYKFDYTLVGVATGVRTRSPDLGLKIYRTAAFKFAENAINSTARYPKPSRKFAVDISRLKKMTAQEFAALSAPIVANAFFIRISVHALYPPVATE